MGEGVDRPGGVGTSGLVEIITYERWWGWGSGLGGSYAMVIAIYVAHTAMMTAMTIKSESYQVIFRSIDILAASGPMTLSVKAEKAPV